MKSVRYFDTVVAGRCEVDVGAKRCEMTFGRYPEQFVLVGEVVVQRRRCAASPGDEFSDRDRRRVVDF